MNRPTPSMLTCLIGAGVLSLAAFAASAQTVSAVALNTAAQAQVYVEATDAAGPLTAAEIQLAAQRDADRNCMRYTGTRIVPRNKPARQCIAQHGRVYTRDDLDRTGEVDIGQALGRLDPSIR